jgi:cyanophycinase-like exopeptidase
VSTYAFLGAGEFEDWHGVVDRRLLEGREGRALVFATASAREGAEVYDGWVAKGLAHYEALGVPAEAPPLRTRGDADDPAVVGALDDAALVFFSGGNPAYLASVLAGSAFWEVLQRRVAEGRTAYAGCSAGVAALSDPTFDSDTDDPQQIWKPGLGYFPQVLFAPHWDVVETWIPGAHAFIAASAPPGGSLIAIDEGTAIVGDGTSWDVVGRGRVAVYEGGAWGEPMAAGTAFTKPLSNGGVATAG